MKRRNSTTVTPETHAHAASDMNSPPTRMVALVELVELVVLMKSGVEVGTTVVVVVKLVIAGVFSID